MVRGELLPKHVKTQIHFMQLDQVQDIVSFIMREYMPSEGAARLESYTKSRTPFETPDDPSSLSCSVEAFYS
eukprot:3785604-Amphidinium_carterae.1